MKTLDYFTDPFEIRDQIRYKDGCKRSHTFMFPYISQLLNMLIENNSPFLQTALEKAIAHNEKTTKSLHFLIKQSMDNGCYFSDSWKREVDFFENGNIVSFRNPLANTGIITNVANVTKESKDNQIDKLIKKLNTSYNNIRNIKMTDLTLEYFYLSFIMQILVASVYMLSHTKSYVSEEHRLEDK